MNNHSHRHASPAHFTDGPVAARSATRRVPRRLAVAAASAGLAAALIVGAPLSAQAHVHVAPNEATAGSYALVTFRVPTESATASTTKVTVDLPTDTPISSASYRPIPGWTATVTTETLPEPVKTEKATITEAATSITWEADESAAIKPGEFQEFAVTLGPIPDTGSIVLPAHQTYSDGTVVDWDEVASDSGDEPEHPAPILYINDPAPGQDAAASSGGTSDAVSLGVGIGGLGVSVLALVVALVVLARQRSARSDSGEK